MNLASPAMPPEAAPPPRSRGPRSPITAAEQRVLRALCLGGTNRSIAAQLVLSPRTVESHISSLLLKTGCRSRTQLVLWALRQGTVPVGSGPSPA